MHAGEALAESLGDLRDLVCRRVERAAGQNEHALSAQAVGLGDNRRGGGLTKDHAVHLREHHRTRLHEVLVDRFVLLVPG